MRCTDRNHDAIRDFRTDEAGNSIIVFALLLPLCMASLALVADVGLWRQKARVQQVETDAAAVAAAHELFMAASPEAVIHAAKGLLKENGVDIGSAQIEVFSPPLEGAHAGSDGVQVRMVRTEQRFFSGLFLETDPELETVSTALKVEGSGPVCILALDPTASAAFDLSGMAVLDVDTCGVQSNSRAADAFEVSGSGQIHAGCAFSAGGLLGVEQITLSVCAEARGSQKPLSDPYAHLEPPAGIASMPCEKPKKTGKKSISLPTGRYCANVVANDLVELEDGGTFIFDGATFDMKSAGAHLYGRNVTLIFVNNGTINMSNAGTVDLTAKTSGPYAGVLMYSDPDTTAEGAVVKITGNAVSSVVGAFYFPKQDVAYTGGTTTKSGCTQLIARRISFSGNSAFSGEHCADAGAKIIERAPAVVLASG